MITVNLEVFIFIYLILGVSFIFGLWFYYDRRENSLYAEQRSKTVFHCVKCGNLYTARGGTRVAACPHCEFKNGNLKF